MTMLTSERHALILTRLRRDGRVVAKALSEELALSEDTIRRDLRALAAAGALQRVHGGALPASAALAPYRQRQGVSQEGKAAIAERAAALVEDGQVVFLDGGTTTGRLVERLPHTLNATVVTHSPSIAMALAEYPFITVELIGGRLFKHSLVAVGASAAEAIARVHTDLAVIGVTGLHPELGLTTGDSEEARMKALICRQSAETVVLASNEKLGAVSPYQVAALSEVGTIVVERTAPQEVVSALRAEGVAVVTA